jgi:hypothetical protein
MRYKIVKLDGRWSYRKHFEYAIIFSNKMTLWQGPLCFSTAQQYFFEAYGWSAEIRQWDNMRDYFMAMIKYSTANLDWKMPDSVNSYWSWTNGHDDLRIYVKSQQELTLFTLKYPVDQ